MKTFAVTFKEVTTKTIEIQAKDKDKAAEIALDMCCDADALDMDKNFDDWSLDPVEIRELQ